MGKLCSAAVNTANNDCDTATNQVKSIKFENGLYYENGVLAGKVISLSNTQAVIERISQNKYMNGQQETINFVTQ